VKVLLAHPGTQHSYRLAAELERHDALLGFYTGVVFPPGGLVDLATRILPSKWRRRVANRRIQGVSPRRLHRRLAPETMAIWRGHRGNDAQEIWHRRAERFQCSIPNSAFSDASAVVGFDTAAWILATRCAQRGIPLVLDQSIGHPDAKLPFYAILQQRYPEWGDGFAARWPEVRAAEQVEHDAATTIVAASAFTKQTLVEHGVDAAKVRVNPYGVDCTVFNVGRRDSQRPLRFIFVGAVNARKGTPLLVDAWQKLAAANAELWLVGAASKQAVSRISGLRGLTHFDRVPRAEVASLMQQCDVFVFPSYFEGFGLVLLEAMACGLPVITTTATAGPDIVTEGQDGWVIEPGDLEALLDRMNYCVEHPQVVRGMASQARATAERFTWAAYGDRWMQILAEVC
jgi:glycosyltransferase involved in cell wall biosynthesis